MVARTGSDGGHGRSATPKGRRTGPDWQRREGVSNQGEDRDRSGGDDVRGAASRATARSAIMSLRKVRGRTDGRPRSSGLTRGKGAHRRRLAAPVRLSTSDRVRAGFRSGRSRRGFSTHRSGRQFDRCHRQHHAAIESEPGSIGEGGSARITCAWGSVTPAFDLALACAP